MNLNDLKYKITNNWAIKIICLMVAIVIYIFHQVSMLDRKVISIPLEVKSEGALLPVSDYPSHVKVAVRAEPSDIHLVTSGGIKAILNLSNYAKSGSYVVPVEISLSNLLRTIDPLEITVKPDKIYISLEEKSIKYIPVEIALYGIPESGYKVSSTEIVPSSVKVIGPENILENTKKIYTKKVNVKGAKTNFSVDTELDNVNSLLQVVPESKFKVSVVITPEEIEKQYDNVIPSVVGLKNNLEITSQILPINIVLTGTVNSLKTYKISNNAVFIDCSKINEAGEYEVPVEFKFGDGISVKDKSNYITKILVENKKNVLDDGSSDVIPEVTETSSENTLNFEEKISENKKELNVPAEDKKNIDSEDSSVEKTITNISESEENI